ncbi:hypothetical protein ACQ4PT_059861 [Festuca glaucescens]
MAAPCKSTPTAMVDGQFCAPHQTAFTLFKSHTWNGSEFEVTNSADGAAVMKVETAHIGYHNLRSLCFLDAASRRPLITVEEFATDGGGRRWEGFRGDGTRGSDRLFVAMGIAGFFTGLCVFIGGNSSGKQAPDFVVRGCYQRGTMTVSRGSGGIGDDKEIAQIGRNSGKVDAHDPVGDTLSG